MLETTPASYDRVMAINLRGPFFLTQMVARRMVAEAGFTRFKSHDFDNPINAYYEVRP